MITLALLRGDASTVLAGFRTMRHAFSCARDVAITTVPHNTVLCNRLGFVDHSVFNAIGGAPRRECDAPGGAPFLERLQFCVDNVYVI